MNRLKIEVIGYSIDYFLKELLKLKINIYYIDKSYKKLILIIDDYNLNKVLNVRSSCKVKILSRYGIIKYKYLIYKYKFVFIFFLMSILIMFYVSSLVLNIKIYGSNEKINKRLYSYLENYKYKVLNSYEYKNSIRNKVLRNNNDLFYIELKKNGTLLNIYYKEKEKEDKKENKPPRDIIAKKDATILSVEAKNGEIVTYKNAYVKKGDILITGTVKNKDEIVKTLTAEGKVIGEVWYKVKVSVPKVYKKKKYINLNKKGLNITFLKDNRNYKNNKIILKDLLFPIYLGIGDKYRIKYIRKIYKEKDVLKLIDRKFKKNSIISKKVLKKYDYNSKIVYVVFVKSREDITSYKYIK